MAHVIQAFGARMQAFPFDWLLTTHEGLNRILDEDFEYFFDESLFFPDPSFPRRLEHSRYEIEFRHHWPFADEWTDAERYKLWLQDIVEKHERRVARFRELRNYPGRVIFMRVAQNASWGGTNYWWTPKEEVITELQAYELLLALKRYFPDLDFILAIMNYSPLDPPPQNTERLRFFHVRRDAREYGHIFPELLSDR